MNESEKNQDSTYLSKVVQSFSSDNLTTSISETYEKSTEIEGENFKIIESIKITRTRIIQIIKTNLPGDKNITINTEAQPVLITGDEPEEVEKPNPENPDSPEKADPKILISLIKLAIWGLICYVFYQNGSFFWGNLFLVCWIVGLIYPDAVIRFGLPPNKANVSKLYTTLMALAFLFENQYNQYNLWGFNSASWFYFNVLQYKVLVVAIVFSLLLLINRDGVILGRLKTEEIEGKKPEELDRCSTVCGYLLLALMAIGIIGIQRLIIGFIKFIF